MHEINENNFEQPIPNDSSELTIKNNSDLSYDTRKINIHNSVKSLFLNIEQEQLNNLHIPNHIQHLEFNNYSPIYIPKLPNNLKKLSVEKLLWMDMYNLPMLEEINVKVDRSVDRLDLDFLPSTLKFLRLDHHIWRENDREYDFCNLPPSLERLELSGIKCGYIPSTVKRLSVGNIIPTEDNMVYKGERDFLELSFKRYTGSYLNCTLKVFNVKELKIHSSGLKRLITDGTLEQIHGYDIGEIVIPKKLENMKISMDTYITESASN